VNTGDVVLPAGYAELLEDLKATVAATRWRTQRTVNTELLRLYWNIGNAVLRRQRTEGWGTRVIDRLSTDLRSAFPEMRGLSQRNLVYMRTFAAAWPAEIAQQPVAQLPWGHITVLLDKVEDQAHRDWYAAAAVQHGWSRNVLLHQIMNRLLERTGAAPSNFPAQLPQAESELAQQLTRDPYVLDFLNITGPVAERDLEATLVDNMQDFLLELGHGFAFVGRQYHFTVDGDDFHIDLLFFNWIQSRFFVVELKLGRFQPEHAGQLGFYVSWVDANLRDPDRHSPTIGILLCTGRNDAVVRYSLASTTAPLAVATYTYDTLPPAARHDVPTEIELGRALTRTLTDTMTMTDTIRASLNPTSQATDSVAPTAEAPPERQARRGRR